jgi:hypothetical protein
MAAPLRPFFVTKTESVRVFARDAADAEFRAREAFAFVGAETEDYQVEEIPSGALTPNPWEE